MQITAIEMTMSVPEGHSPAACLLKWNKMEYVHHADLSER